MRSQSASVYPSQVEIIEVGLRDGLQNEPALIPVDQKIALIDALVEAGVRQIQVASFVHPRLVPQMADADELCARIDKKPGVVYSGLALNTRGVERAHKAGLDTVDISVSASNAHSMRNVNRSQEEALDEFEHMVALARKHALSIRGGIQCAFGYLYEQDVRPETVVDLAHRFLDLGVDALALADSSGLANPRQLDGLLSHILDLAGETPIILHLHDTRGMGLANVLAALQTGIRSFEASIGGLGGCPFIEGASGNIATEDTVHMLHEMGIETGIALPRLAEITWWVQGLLGKTVLPGKVYQFHRPT